MSREGARVEPGWFASISPVDGGEVGRFPRSGPEDVARVIDVARRAAPPWAALPPDRRATRLEAFRHLLSREADPLARLITREVGKPYSESLSSDVFAAAEAVGVLARRGPDWLKSRVERRSWLDRLRGVRRLECFREPLGVVGVIGTWNYPLGIDVLQIASALLAGNAVVWKPSERASAVAERVAGFFYRAGVPDGALSLLWGDGSTGEALSHCRLDKLLFTGSSGVGRRVQAAAGTAGTPVCLEMSGSDAALVFDDADIDRTVRGVLWGAFANSGQTCVAFRRIIAQDRIYNAFVARLVAAVKALRSGDPFDPSTDLGPLRGEDLVRRLEDLVADADHQGARLLTGGKRVKPGSLHFEPTLLAEVPSSARVLREEYFGPVSLLSRAADVDDMVRQANESPFGLGAGLWTQDLARARAVAARLEVGAVWVNDAIVAAGDMRAPFGGTKASGFGRVHGPEGLAELTRAKWVETSSPRGLRPHHFPYNAEKINQLRRFLKWRHGS